MRKISSYYADVVQLDKLGITARNWLRWLACECTVGVLFVSRPCSYLDGIASKTRTANEELERICDEAIVP
jgi:hypothetical protein